jgi:hypothetical protein
MRRIAALLFVLFACAACAAEDPFAAVAARMREELDDTFLVERTGVFVVAGDLPRRRFDRFTRHTIDACAAALHRDFFTQKPDTPVKVYLFGEKASYQKWVKKLAGFRPGSPFGFYLRDRRALMMNIGTGGGTLVHEMTHVLTDADFPDCPTWFFEGLGSLFEQCHVTRDGHIRGLVNWRLPVLRRGGFVKLTTLISTTRAEFRGSKESLHYANARYLCLYLQERGLLRKFYRTFRGAHRAGQDATGWASFKEVIGEPPDAFETKWHDWVKTLKWPPG